MFAHQFKWTPWFAAYALVLVGCASDSQILDQTQAAAQQTALERGRFDLNCPSAQVVPISRELIEPTVQGPVVAGIPRAEYTVGVEGCNKRATYVVICQVGGDGCVAGDPSKSGGR